MLDSYSTKEMTNKNRKSKDSYKNIIDSKILREIKSQNQNQNPYQNNLNKSKRLFQNKDTKKLNKSPIKNKEFPLTDRKTKDQIEINLEKIELLSKEIKKIKENLKKSATGNNSISLSCNLGKNKSTSTKKIEKKESKKFINYNNNNVIKVYLSNKTRNKTKKKKNNLNSDNLVTNKSNNQRMYNLAYTYRKDNEQKSNDYDKMDIKLKIDKINYIILILRIILLFGSVAFFIYAIINVFIRKKEKDIINDDGQELMNL